MQSIVVSRFIISDLAHPRWVAAALALLCLAPSAQAATFAATELSYDNLLLSQFNLINLGNFNATSSQSIGGRALVGGNVTTTGTETVCAAVTCGNTSLGAASTPTAIVTATSTSSNNATAPNPTTANYGYGALTVFGNVSGAVTITKGGDLDIAGSVSANTYTLNRLGGANIGGATQTGTTVSGATEIRTTAAGGPGTATNIPTGATNESNDNIGQVFAPFGKASSLATNFSTPLKSLYSGLANLPGSPGVTTENLPKLSSSIFTSGVDYTTVVNGTTYKYGVVQTTLADLAAQKTGFGIANNAADNATFVIVTGTGTSTMLPSLANTDSKVIYDFVDASNLMVGGNFNATILAPLATLTQASGSSINGTVIVASMTQTQALNGGNAFTGDLTGLYNFSYNARVPEPASVALLGVGLAAVAAFRRRKA